MRHIPAIIVLFVCVFVFVGLVPSSPHVYAQATDDAAEAKVKTEIRTYDISELLDEIPQFGNVIPHHPHQFEVQKAVVFGEPDNDEVQSPRQERITAIMDCIKNSISRDQWVPVGLNNTMAELDSMLIISAPASDHEAIAILLAQLAAARHRMVNVRWQAFEISTAQLHDLKERLADGGLLLSAKNAKTLTDELETGKLKVTPIASARLVCMNNQQTSAMPSEQQSMATGKNEKGEPIAHQVNHAGTFAIVPTMTTDQTHILTSTAVEITTGPGEDTAAAGDTRTYKLQSTVVITDGGGVLMTASNGKTAQAGREVVVFLQVGVVKSARAGADAPR